MPVVGGSVIQPEIKQSCRRQDIAPPRPAPPMRLDPTARKPPRPTRRRTRTSPRAENTVRPTPRPATARAIRTAPPATCPVRASGVPLTGQRSLSHELIAMIAPIAGASHSEISRPVDPAGLFMATPKAPAAVPEVASSHPVRPPSRRRQQHHALHGQHEAQLPPAEVRDEPQRHQQDALEQERGFRRPVERARHRRPSSANAISTSPNPSDHFQNAPG